MLEYSRETMDTLNAVSDYSLHYWRNQARGVFAARKDVNKVFVFRSGHLRDAEHAGKLKPGARHASSGECVIIASAQGKFGAKRRNFYPA